MYQYLKFLLVASLFSVSANAEVTSKNVEYKDGSVVMKGVLYSDSTIKAPDAAIVVLPEWWGQNDYSRSRAHQLAELGYVAFAADMYGDGKNTTDVAKAKEFSAPFYTDSTLMIRRVQSAVDALKKQAANVKDRVAVIGYCFGGQSALTYGLSGGNVAGIASFHGGLKIAPSDDSKARARFLIMNGDADPMVPVEDRNSFLDRLRKDKIDFTFIDYAGALHAFTNPNATKFGIPGIGYSQSADTQSWGNMKQFLTEIFARK